MNAVAFSGDGRRLFAAGEDGLIRVLEPGSGREVVQLGGHTDAVISLCSGPDDRLVSSSRDGTVKLWGTTTPPAGSSPYPATGRGAPAAVTGNPGAPEHLEARWTGDADARDDVGRRDGLMQNGVDLVRGRTGKAFLFDGEVGVVRIDSLPPSLADSTRSFTLVLWVGPTDSGGPRGTVVSHRPDWDSRRKSWGWKLVAGERWVLRQSNREDQTVVSDDPVARDRFTHVALVFDREAGAARIFLDGNLQDGILRRREGSPWANDGALRLGRDAFAEGTWFDPFRGLIDDVQVFSGALTPREIRALALGDTPSMNRN
jgi:WD40 repeat protein